MSVLSPGMENTICYWGTCWAATASMAAQQHAGLCSVKHDEAHCFCWWHPAVKAGGWDGGLRQTSPHCSADWHMELFWSRCWHSPFANVPSKWGEQIYGGWKKKKFQDGCDHLVPGQQAGNTSHKGGRKWGKKGKVALELAQKDAALPISEYSYQGLRNGHLKEKLLFKHLPQSLWTKRSCSTHGHWICWTK